MKRRISIYLLYTLIFVTIVSVVGFSFGLVTYNNKTKVYAKTDNNSFQVLKNGEWSEFFVKGVNIGAALPGKWFTEFPEDEAVYLDWFEKIGQMNANTIRIYTLLPPQFYTALKSYNGEHSKEPLWLLQEIWPEESPEGQDYLKKEYVDGYNKEIEYGIDAIHGNAVIKERRGRAYGVYKSDVSKYVLGYLVGRELEPDEVIATNEANKGFSYKGEYLSSEKTASATEAWLAMNCDYVMKYEDSNYHSQHPVAIVSWPTLDVQEHDSEWNSNNNKELEYNDKVSVDINNIMIGTKMKAGFFGAYHIYPNYPDFMNNESKYNSYMDHEGRLRYGGYLQEFIEKHTKYPALVAEFGLATGMGNAHSSPDGLNHGGLTEEQQGNGIVRMMTAIQKEGYAGGVIFEWIDEWAKKTWTTEPYMIPYDRHAYWHNAMDPEQNYGLLAMESAGQQTGISKAGKGHIKTIELKQDSTYLYLNITLDNIPDFKTEKLMIGLDTYDRSKGEFKFTKEDNITAPTGLEFLIDIGGEQDAKFLVPPAYNLANNKFSSVASWSGVFEEVKTLINPERATKAGSKIEAIYRDDSKLNFGKFDSNAFNHWYLEEKSLYVRIPWGKLNFTDPSSLMVLEDSSNTGDLSRDKLKTTKTEGILTSVLLFDIEKREKLDILSTEVPYLWEQWEDLPQYKERLKKSYFIIQDYFEGLK